MKEKNTTNEALSQTNQSDNTHTASTESSAVIKKFDSVHAAEFESELRSAITFVDRVRHQLLGGDWETPLSEAQICIILEWAFRTGHQLGVSVAGKDQINTNEHNKIFDEAFEVCRRDFKAEDPTTDETLNSEKENGVLGLEDPIDNE